MKKINYKILDEMREAWVFLVEAYGLKNSSTSYNENYKKDPRLPSFGTIRNKFNNISWNEFIGAEEPYETIDEMREAWVRLVEEHQLEHTTISYNEHYKKDPRLLSLDTIKKKFNTLWSDFIGFEKNTFYKTLKDTRSAWKILVREYRLKNTKISYDKNYKKNPRLPSFDTIKINYNVNWNQFIEVEEIEFYETLEEIRKAWKILVREYRLQNTELFYNSNYKKDPRLPSFATVSRRFNIRWFEFIGVKKRFQVTKTNFYETLEEIREAWMNLVERYGLENTQPSYKKNRKRDRRLPSFDTFRIMFNVTWREFIQAEPLYETLEEIREAWITVVREYGLKNTNGSYRENHQKDPRLPSTHFLVKFKITWGEFKNGK